MLGDTGTAAQRLTWVWALAALVLAAVTVAVLVADGPLPGEIGMIRWLQGAGQPVPDIADAVRVATNTSVYLIVGVLPAAWLIRRHEWRGVAAVAVCLLALLVVQPVSKRVIDRERPTEAQVEVRAEHTSLSYPSGHSLSTSAVFGVAAVLAWRSGRRGLAVAFCAPIAATGVASGVQGVHWASDAIAGTIIGAMAAGLAAWVLRRGPPATRR